MQAILTLFLIVTWYHAHARLIDIRLNKSPRANQSSSLEILGVFIMRTEIVFHIDASERGNWARNGQSGRELRASLGRPL